MIAAAKQPRCKLLIDAEHGQKEQYSKADPESCQQIIFLQSRNLKKNRMKKTKHHCCIEYNRQLM